METEVWRKLPTRFDVCGQVVGNPIEITEQVISPGMAQRLHRYALDRLYKAGFGLLASGSKVTVYTLDADDPPPERVYCVRWSRKVSVTNGYIELSGIMTRRGWPSLDHGFTVGEEP